MSLRAIGMKLGFGVKLTLGLARHSYGTKQKIDSTPVAFISDAMGTVQLSYRTLYEVIAR